jgi:hypothetical protein
MQKIKIKIKFIPQFLETETKAYLNLLIEKKRMPRKPGETRHNNTHDHILTTLKG